MLVAYFLKHRHLRFLFFAQLRQLLLDIEELQEVIFDSEAIDASSKLVVLFGLFLLLLELLLLGGNTCLDEEVTDFQAYLASFGIGT